MKKSIKTFLVACFLLVNCGLLFSQDLRVELGDKYFDQYAYEKAMIFYEEAIDRGNNDWDINAKLGDCYYFTSNPKMALNYYEKIIDNEYIKDIYLLRYAQCLQSTGSPQNSVINAFENYYKKIGKTGSINQRNSTEIKQAELENLSINTQYSDFGSYIFNDILYFSSSREKENNIRHNKRRYKWNEYPFLEIYEARIIKDSDSINSKLIPAESSKIGINTIAHESTVAITKKGNTMYFSGGIVKNNKLVYNERGTANLKLQRATDSANKWYVTKKDIKTREFFDYENYSFGNPALSPDNKLLFFVSCAPFPDAVGQMDIYYVRINDDGPYGKIKPLPVGINSSGRESFPYISEDWTLYFSSDGIHNDSLGLGLLDIYKVKDIDKVIQMEIEPKVVHLKSPFNSVKDDFAFYIEEPKDENDCEVDAYFSSNWEGHPNAQGDDDIYKVKVKRTRTIQGTIKDSISGNNLDDAIVELIDSTGMVLDTLQISSSGTYNFKVKCDQSFSLRGSRERYYDALKKFNANEESYDINLKLKPFPCEITVYHVYKYETIEGDRIHEKDLLPVLELLKTNPYVKVMIESHTDSRGTNEYNQGLSERRAQASKSYLINAGVPESQIISTIGYGEERLCVSEEDIQIMQSEEDQEAAHQKNRRSRFLIVAYNESTLDCQDCD